MTYSILSMSYQVTVIQKTCTSHCQCQRIINGKNCDLLCIRTELGRYLACGTGPCRGPCSSCLINLHLEPLKSDQQHFFPPTRKIFIPHSLWKRSGHILAQTQKCVCIYISKTNFPEPNCLIPVSLAVNACRQLSFGWICIFLTLSLQTHVPVTI